MRSSRELLRNLLHLTSSWRALQLGQFWSTDGFDDKKRQLTGGLPAVAKELAIKLLLSFFPDLFLQPHLGWVTVFFRSTFKASGEKIGSFASSASLLTQFIKALNVTIFLDFVYVSWACRHGKVQRKSAAYEAEGFCWVEVPHWLHCLHFFFAAHEKVREVLEATAISIGDLWPASQTRLVCLGYMDGFPNRWSNIFRAFSYALLELIARKPFTKLFALPLVNLSRKYRQSLFEGTLLQMMESKAVMKAGYSK